MKDNKLIAEFMGYKLTKCNRGQAWERPTLSSIHDNYKLHGRLWVENDSYYKWGISWDWLMPVIEKIENDGLDPHGMLDNSLRKNKQKRWRSIEDLYNVAVYLINIYNNERK
tara:strand:+ start:468 stop:803 length:336 start_codon:yes stop_codon:yes gene_type:complete